MNFVTQLYKTKINLKNYLFILGVETCFCEFPNMEAEHNGILCNTSDGSSHLYGSCDAGQKCTGGFRGQTNDFANRKSKLCETSKLKISQSYLQWRYIIKS